MCPLKALGLPCSSCIYLLSDVIFSFVLFVILGLCVFVFLVYVCVVWPDDVGGVSTAADSSIARQRGGQGRRKSDLLRVSFHPNIYYIYINDGKIYKSVRLNGSTSLHNHV